MIRALALVALMSLPPQAMAWTTCHGHTVADVSTELLPCGDRPNCVSTEHPDPDRQLRAPRDLPLAALRKAIAAEPRSQVMAEGNGWLIVHFHSRVFGFVDEAHFIVRPDGTLAMRSGACTGYWDFGVNRRRLERLVRRATQDD